MKNIALFVFASIIPLGCGGSNEPTELGEVSTRDNIYDTYDNQNKENVGEYNNDGLINDDPAKVCTGNLPNLDIESNTCYWRNADNRFCSINDDCTGPTRQFANYLKFCVQGICSSTPKAQVNCPLNMPHYQAECYNALTDDLNCGGSGKSCTADAPTCTAGICSDHSCDQISCPGSKPNCQQGKCFDGLLDNNNCGRLGNTCPSSRPYCYLGECSIKNFLNLAPSPRPDCLPLSSEPHVCARLVASANPLD